MKVNVLALTWLMLMERIELIKGDITQMETDAIVNAANTSLLGGGGVDGAIHRAGGTAILEACRQIVARQGGCKTGEAVITTAGKLPSKYVIHTVGPVWNGGTKGERELLANCYKNALSLAVKHTCTSIAFPNISTGVYRFPKADAALIAIATVRHFLEQDTTIMKVVFVSFDEESYNLYQTQLEQ